MLRAIGRRRGRAASRRRSVARPGGGTVYSAQRLTAAVTNESPWWVARCLEVEVTSQGATPDDALANLKGALELYFENEPRPPESFEPARIETDEIAA
jgi:predicted RNase H-like HicB family nuclease